MPRLTDRFRSKRASQHDLHGDDLSCMTILTLRTTVALRHLPTHYTVFLAFFLACFPSSVSANLDHLSYLSHSNSHPLKSRLAHQRYPSHPVYSLWTRVFGSLSYETRTERNSHSRIKQPHQLHSQRIPRLSNLLICAPLVFVARCADSRRYGVVQCPALFNEAVM